ncbi:MAG TPA: heme-binding protein [Candidatus Aquilonibacter sp.]|nr:heme-binding protein [Candidatus Aquilonibacter sp.]
MRAFLKSLFFLMPVFLTAGAIGQAPLPYGPPISLENAKKAAAAAAAVAHKNNWNMAIAVVNPDGTLVYYEKMDNTQLGSAKFAVDKARSAALFKRPTKVFQDRLTAGSAGLPVLAVEGAVPVEGGIPLILEGHIVGAIGVSGDSSDHDAQCAQAGVETLK